MKYFVADIILKHDLTQKIKSLSYSTLLRCTPSLPGTRWFLVIVLIKSIAPCNLFIPNGLRTVYVIRILFFTRIKRKHCNVKANEPYGHDTKLCLVKQNKKKNMIQTGSPVERAASNVKLPPSCVEAPWRLPGANVQLYRNVYHP